MYLKKLSLKGFKSFPMKTDIYFEEGVTAIVGPNGSGKSNISDAIRWVLGEQSVKSLRGEKMEDVIFSGTDSKNQMNYCEVSITLDNSIGLVDEEFEELVVKRRAYRSGESEYYINNSKCRLKDVRETLMDTGIGKDGYSIIEQGKVEEILSNNPANKRKIFDEACGIAKYRYKKNEAEKNLKKSSENLERIIDIYMEIDNQLKPLERQQEKAKKYLEISSELKKIEINDIIIKNSDLENEISDLAFQMSELEKEKKLLEEEKNTIEKELSELTISVESVELLIEQYNEKSVELGNSISGNKSEQQITNEKINGHLKDIERKKSEIDIISKKSKLEEEALEKANKKADENSYEIEELENILGKIFDKKLFLEKNVKNIQEEIEGNKNISIEILEKKEEIAGKYATVNANIENMKSKVEYSLKNIDSISKEIEDIEKNILEKKTEKDKLQVVYNDFCENISSSQDKLDNLEKKLNKFNSDYQNIVIKNGSLNSKKNTYLEMENHHEGFNKGVKEVLKNKSIQGVFGAFGEIISVPQKYEKAMEAALGATIQNIVVDGEQNAKKAIDYLKKNNLGRVTFLPVNTMKSNRININTNAFKSRPIDIASNLIEYDERFRNVVENLMGRVVVIDNIDKAISFAKESGHRYRIVTLDGDIINPGGSMTGGSLKTSGNILSRKRIIKELHDEISENEDILLTIKSSIDKLNDEKRIIEESIISLGEKKSDIDKNLISIATEIKLIEGKKLEKQKAILDSEKSVEDTKEIIEENKKKFEEYKNVLDNLSNKNDDNSSNILELQKNLSEIDEKLNKVVKEYNDKNLNLVRMKQVFENNITEIERMKSNIEEYKDTCIKLNDSVTRSEDEINLLDDLIESLKSDLKTLEAEKDDIIEKISDKKFEKEDLRNRLEEKTKELRVRDRDNARIGEEIFKVDSKLNRAKYSRDNLLSNLFEKYEMTIVQAMELKDNSINIDYAKIEKLKKSIKALGNVNLDSIEEYDEVKVRHDFYKGQKEDLEESIISINSLIDDLVENMEKEFVDRFYTINENFKKVYKKLFGGGTANLKITDEENILSCDIEITAQPPGKKMKNLSLLSGGEKALTAICILFGILISKPTPFCILDEIEAPLDDVNVYRFGEYLKELSEDTQFIAVTHRRGTMEVADYIYGVTMQEKGVSSILSIKLNEAKDMVEE